MDNSKLPLSTAVELSYVEQHRQLQVEKAISDSNRITSKAQAKQIRELQESNDFTEKAVGDLLTNA